MITIPTGDLVGIVGDAAPFACPDRDDELHCVRLAWDGKALHAQALSRIHMGWSTWHPDDDHEVEHQDTLFTDWGGADKPWAATINLDDAKHLVSTFKLGGKQYYTPLTLDKLDRAVKVVRSRDTGFSAINIGYEDAFVEFPNIEEMLAKAAKAKAVGNLSVNQKYLADFAKVRPRGNGMKLRFTGVAGLVQVSIGERFRGAIMPIRDSDKATSAEGEAE